MIGPIVKNIIKKPSAVDDSTAPQIVSRAISHNRFFSFFIIKLSRYDFVNSIRLVAVFEHSIPRLPFVDSILDSFFETQIVKPIVFLELCLICKDIEIRK